MNSAFDGVVGQERAVAQLAQALTQPRHAYLLVGPPNVGKTAAAGAWCQALFCRHRTACGACTECRTFLHGNYADYHLWQPAGKSTSIEQIRELVRQADLAPYRGDYQVHVVFADSLSLPAANCLLKTLEEPPQGTILLLLAQSVADILPTIVSRCQRIPFNLVPEPLIRQWLVETKGVAPAIAETAARRSGGRIGYALALLDQEATSPRLLAARDPLEALEEADRAAALPQDRQL
ncbi:MAG: DNA polymerase III subunit, partial [Candidatus Sericytochromatia bacterium]|nr:DNA polymerase III subunit [Candidatus Tanganyikabacteria bacterium]